MRKSAASGSASACVFFQPRTIALPSGCAESCSAAAARRRSSSVESAFCAQEICVSSGVPQVSVPVLSKARTFAPASRSSASPSRTRKPCFVALPIAAMIAVGVARTSAHGQKTTRIVTARMISPESSHVSAAAVSAMTTTHVANRSAKPTIFAFPASADCTSRIMRWMELSSPTFVARMVNAPN